MNATITPPPPTPSSATPPAPRGAGPGKPVTIVLIVIGVLVLVGALVPAIRSAVSAATRVTDTLTADATGIASLNVAAAASTFRIEYGDVDQATLEVSEARAEWTLERDGDELKVATRDGLFNGWDWGWDFGRDQELVVLTLPEAVRETRLDADLSLAAGDLEADGEFGRLDLELGAGSMDVSGSARTLSVDVSAGEGRIELADVEEADVSVSAGRLVGELTGTAPRALGVVVSAGSLDLTIPDETYDVRSDVSAGAFDNRLDTSDSASHRVTVEVSAGNATLRGGD